MHRMVGTKELVLVITIGLAASSLMSCGQKNSKTADGSALSSHAENLNVAPDSNSLADDTTDWSPDGIATRGIIKNCSESLLWLTTQCDTCVERTRESNCTLERFGRIGMVDDRTFYFGVYCNHYADEDPSRGTFSFRTIHVFEAGDDTSLVVPVLEEGGPDDSDSEIADPEIIETENGPVMHIFMTSGNGGFDMGVYLLRVQKEWQHLDVPSWFLEARKFIPDGYTFCRGGSVDLAEMIAIFPLFKPDDGCCCPTGGSVTMDIEIEGLKIVVRDGQYSTKPCVGYEGVNSENN